MPQNLIPTHNGVAAVQSAAGAGAPVQVHQGAPAGIPQHPGVVQQHIQQVAPSRSADDVARDFFANAGFEDDFSGGEDFTPPPNEPAPPSTDLVNVDDLLSGGQFPDDPPPTPVQQQAPPQQQQQVHQQPQVQQPQQPAPQPQPQPQAQPSQDDLQAQAIDYLRGNVYKLDDDHTRRALTEPETVLPALAARVHVNVVHEMAQQMHRVLPMLIQQEVSRRTAAIEAKSDFFRRYPKLNRPEWEPVIAESLTYAAQLHQGKPRDVIMREGAALAAYRLRSQAPRPQPPQHRTQPFVPASPGGAGPTVPTNPQQQPNVWAELSADPDLFNFD